MSLLHPTLGELLDRRILLSLKIVRGKERGVNVIHHQEELLEITHILLNTFKSLETLANTDKLNKLHEEMFDLIDKAEQGIEVSAVHLQKLNRQRVELREQIDKDSGQFRGPERI